MRGGKGILSHFIQFGHHMSHSIFVDPASDFSLDLWQFWRFVGKIKKSCAV
jgi:hypothetical protein